jgi:hypothetical protein
MEEHGTGRNKMEKSIIIIGAGIVSRVVACPRQFCQAAM